jgi:hypothetical protein
VAVVGAHHLDAELNLASDLDPAGAVALLTDRGGGAGGGRLL